MPLRTVRILCFGDSLTSGYTHGGSMHHPYAHTMMKTLRMAFPEIKLDISVKGEPGDEVMPSYGQFQPRLKTACNDALSHGEPYDWILLLGGTNDLANPRLEPEELFAELEKLYDICFSHGAKVIALTVPECGAKFGWLNNHRDAVNEMIKNYPKENFHVFDLYAQIPFHKLSGPKRKSIWDDSVHLTTIGYSVMGDKIADFFLPLLKDHINAMPRDPPSPVSPSTAASTSTTKSKIYSSITSAATAAAAAVAQSRVGANNDPDDNGDDIDFEEEGGDPSILSQGYIVVRKRDLD